MLAWRKKNSLETLGLVLLVLLGAAVRIFFLIRFKDTDGGDPGMVACALNVLENPGLFFNFDGNSSALYKYGIASVMYFWRDPILAPRVFTMLFGVFLVIPFYGTLKVLFDRTVAFFSSLILVFYPLHVVQSNVTSSDAVYYFFLFGCFYYFFSYRAGRKGGWALGAAAFFFNIASLLRFESWLFIPVFFLLLWSRGKKTALFFSGLLSVFPAVHLFLCRFHDLPFFYSFTTPAQAVHAQILAGRLPPYDPRPWDWLAVLWRDTGGSLVAGGLGGIVWACVTRQKRTMAVFFLWLLGAFTLSSMQARALPSARYSIVLGLFLIPYAWFFAEKALKMLPIRKGAPLVLLLILPALDFFRVARHPSAEITNVFFRDPPEVETVASWLRHHRGRDEAVIISGDWDDPRFASIILRSGIPSGRYHASGNVLLRKETLESRRDFERFVLEHPGTRYLILNSESRLQRILNFDLDRRTQSAGGVVLEAVFAHQVPGSGERYLIYEISF